VSREQNIQHSFREGNKNHRGNHNPNSKYKQSNNPENRVNQHPSSIEEIEKVQRLVSPLHTVGLQY